MCNQLNRLADYRYQQSRLKAYQSSRKDAGFTLIELMISIVLGLLLVAAASQLFVGGVINSRLQQAGADMQDGGLFGLDSMSRDIRLANFGNITNRFLTDVTPWGGIVLTADTAASTASNLPVYRTSNSAGAYISSALLSNSDGDVASSTLNQWTGLSNVTTSTGGALKSDQLTIQFAAPADMVNCEGVPVTAGSSVIERYFIRLDTITVGNTGSNVQNLVLACNAASVTPPAASPALANLQIVTGLGNPGQVIMNRVDQIHFLLGTQAVNGNFVYYTINQYKAAAVAARNAGGIAPRILSVKVAALVRSLDNTNSSLIDPAKIYTLFDQSVKPIAETNQNTNRYVRQAYLTTIALRNGMGAAS
ncbi:PilW family protein [Aquirhabdus sp.]|uniref:PilW family protein n=1 Tax=Aquirhabdus sp. TaxID=2824160 RepID=UPI00396CFCFE